MLKVEAQARLIRVLRLAGSSATEGWCSAEPDLASSSASSLPFKKQWPGTHSTSRHLSALSRATAACTSFTPSSGACELPTASTSDLRSHMRGALRQSSFSSNHEWLSPSLLLFETLSMPRVPTQLGLGKYRHKLKQARRLC